MFSYSSRSLLFNYASLGAGAAYCGFKGTPSGEDRIMCGSHILLDCY